MCVQEPAEARRGRQSFPEFKLQVDVDAGHRSSDLLYPPSYLLAHRCVLRDEALCLSV